jgi:hypothetical protein
MDRARTFRRAANQVHRLRCVGSGPGAALLVGTCLWACGGPARATESGAAPSSQPGREGASPRALSPRALSYLQDDYERIFPERVRLAHYGRVRFAARDGDDQGGDGERSDAIDKGESPSLVVVDQVDRRVRVVAPQDHYRLLLWLEVADLYTVVTEHLALQPDGASGKGAGASIRVNPGLPVDVDGERGGMAHIRHRDDCVSFSGLVPRSALGTLFVPIEPGERAVDAAVVAGTAVYDRPGGRQVARFLADCDVAASGPDTDGHRPIRYATEWFELRGWVPTTGTKSSAGGTGNASWGYGLGRLGLWGPRSRLALPERTCLFARRGGPAIGLITEDTDAPVAPPVDGWWPVPLETGWGDLTVWVAHDRARTAERTARERSLRGAVGETDDADEPADESGDDGEADHASGGDGKSEGLAPDLRPCR